MTYVMSRRAYRHYILECHMTDAELLTYINLNLGLRGTFTQIQVTEN